MELIGEIIHVDLDNREDTEPLMSDPVWRTVIMEHRIDQRQAEK